MKIAVTGFVGAGKSSLCKLLGKKLGLSVINEGMAEIADASARYTRSMRSANRQEVEACRQALIESFVDWGRTRSDQYARHDRFIADRWEADLLSWWLMSFAFRSSGVDEITNRLMADLNHKSRLFDFIILLPLRKPFAESGSKNDDGMLRVFDRTTQVLDYSITYGLIHNFTQTTVIRVPAKLDTSEARASFVVQSIVRTRQTVETSVLR